MVQINTTTVAQRIQEAEQKLGRKLNKKEIAAIYNPPPQKSGKGTSVEQKNFTPLAIAQKFKASAEKHWGAVNTDEFQNLLSAVNKDNVIDMLKEYNSISPKESFIEMICDEKGNSSADRKSAISNVFNKLLTKAKEEGVDVTHFKNSFNTELNHQFSKIGLTNTEKLDEIVNALIQATENKEQLTDSEIAEIAKTPASKQHTAADKLLATRINSAQKSFNNQLKQDGWAGDVADFVGKLYGSKNTADNIRKDLKLAKNQFAQLEAAKKEGREAYEAKFQEIFGTKFDPQNIKVYEKKEATYAKASAHHSIEEFFKDQSGYFLNRKGLSDEYTTMPGTVPTTILAATKEDVFKREAKKFANFLGENGQEALATALKNAGLENASVDEKFEFVQKMAKDVATQLHKNTLEAGDGKEFAKVQHEYEYSYKAAFGVKNDIMKRVTDYNLSQQAGAGAVKAGVVIGASLTAAFTGGTSLAAVAGITAGATVATEVTDKFTSGEVMDTLKEDGIIAAIKKGNENTNYTEIFKQAVISGGMVLVGGGAAKGIQFVSKGLTTTQQAAAMFGTDVAVGMGAEKLMTGEITVEGTVFNVLLSGAGNIVAVKMAAKAAASGKAANKGATNPEVAQMKAAHPEIVEKLATYKGSDGKPLFKPSEIDDIFRNCSKTIKDSPEKMFAILDNPEEIASIMSWKNRGAGLWRAIGEPFQSTIDANPALFGVKPKAIASPEFKAQFNNARSINELEDLVRNSTNTAELDFLVKQLQSRPAVINAPMIDDIMTNAKNKIKILNGEQKPGVITSRHGHFIEELHYDNNGNLQRKVFRDQNKILSDFTYDAAGNISETPLTKQTVKAVSDNKKATLPDPELLAQAGFTDDVIKDLKNNSGFYGPELVDEALDMIAFLEKEAAAGKPITKELIESAIDKFSPGASGSSATVQRSMIANNWRHGNKVYEAYGQTPPTRTSAPSHNLPKVITDEVNRNLTDVQRANLWRYGNAQTTEVSPAIRQKVTNHIENMLGKPIKPENLIAGKTDKGTYLSYFDETTNLTTTFTFDGQPNGQWIIHFDAAGKPMEVDLYSIYSDGKFRLR